MNDSKQKLADWLTRHREPMIAFLQELVSVPSDNPPGDCEAISRCVYRQLQQFGLAPSLYPVDEDTARQAGMRKAANVVAEVPFGCGEGPVIGLNAHGDVVPPGLGWTYDPYGGQIHDGKLYGRGAAVSKSDIAAYTFAVLALRECSTALSGKAVLAFTFDEETGGTIGPKRLLEQKIIRPDAVICAGFTHAAVHAHNGCLHLEIEVRGKSAHAAIPHTGVDAIEHMVKLLGVLYVYRDELSGIRSEVAGIDSPTLTVGLISGGINTNVVPDRCVIRLDRRMIPEERAEAVERELRERIGQAAATMPGIRVDIRRLLLADRFGPVPAEIPLIRKLGENWSAVMGGEMPVHGVPLYADARHFHEAGIPTVMFGAGPRTLEEANGHRADEHVRLDDLLHAAIIVAGTLHDLLDAQTGEAART